MGVYNLKNILFGVGIGMILTSMLNISFGERELTAQDIKDEAQKHNLIVISADELIDKQNDSNTTDNADNPNSPNDIRGTANKTDVFIQITIEKNLSSEKVAKLLKDNFLISDEAAFINELEKQSKSNKIQVGKYNIKKGIEIQELIKIITTRK